MKEICISIIVPIYNAEKYLVKCIDSIIGQTYQNLEIILVDDGSTDGSLGICNEYASVDERIKVIHKENAGIVVARKTGVANATGQYVTFVDADDYIDLDTYEVLMQGLSSGDVDVVAFGLLEEYPARTVKKGNHYPSMTYCREQIEQNLFPSMLSFGKFFDFGILPNLVCKLIKRTFWLESAIEVDNSITVGEDADATFQLLVNAQSVQLIDYAPYHYVKRNNSMMWKGIKEGSIEKLQSDLSKAFQKAGVQDVLERQLDDFIAFVSLLKQPQRIMEVRNALVGKRIALYGAGGFGQAVFGTYGEQVSVWVDGNYHRYLHMEFEVSPVESLMEHQDEYDVVCVAILNTEICQSIKEKLVSMGIEKPIWYYDKRNYLRNFTKLNVVERCTL